MRGKGADLAEPIGRHRFLGGARPTTYTEIVCWETVSLFIQLEGDTRAPSSDQQTVDGTHSPQTESEVSPLVTE